MTDVECPVCGNRVRNLAAEAIPGSGPPGGRATRYAVRQHEDPRLGECELTQTQFEAVRQALSS